MGLSPFSFSPVSLRERTKGKGKGNKSILRRARLAPLALILCLLLEEQLDPLEFLPPPPLGDPRVIVLPTFQWWLSSSITMYPSSTGTCNN